MLKVDNSVLVKNGVNTHKTRTVYSNNSNNGCSHNWKADWARILGKTYAQVVKFGMKQEHTVQNQNSSDHTARQRVEKSQTNVKKCQISTSPVCSANMKRLHNVNKIMCQDNNVRREKIGQVHLGFQCKTKNRFALLAPSTETQGDNNTDCPSVENYHISGTGCQGNDTQSVGASKGIEKITKRRPNSNNHKGDKNKSNNMEAENPKTPKMCSNDLGTDDKYRLALQIRNKNKERMRQANTDPTFRNWSKQNEDKFGFIPLGPLVIPKSDKRRSLGSDPIKLYNATRSQTDSNFLTSQIQVPSQLNPDVWQNLLKGYWDEQLPFLIRYGFPLDLNRNSKLGTSAKNHLSALAFPQDLKAYLQEEIQFGAICGPFREPPLDNLHISPFMTREKPGAPHRRVIIDLSFPSGEAVNSNISKESYLGTDFILTLPSIDTITNKVRKFGKGSLLYKIDISRAFRHVKIDPRDYFLLGLRHQDYYLDTCLPFGFRHGSGIFQRLSDAIRFIMKSQGYDVINYIDDVIGFGTISTAKPSFEALKSLLHKLGLDISFKKLVTPTTKVTCLGVDVDTVDFTVSIPDQKLTEIIQICNNWTEKSQCTKKELQSLLGALLYVSKCVKSARFFLNRMLDTLRSHFSKEKISLDTNFHRDLNWFKKFLTKFNGKAFFVHRPIQATIELDACLKGLGAVYVGQVYAIPIPQYCQNFSIVHLEMLNILVAVRVWKQYWKNKRVLLKCDNQAVVTVLNSGKTQDLTLAAIARNIMMDVAQHDIDLQVIHILGVDNKIADLLSRWYITNDPYKILKKLLPNPRWLHLPQDIANIDWSV